MFRYLVQQKHPDRGKKRDFWSAICREMFLQALGVEEIQVGYRRILTADNAECTHQQSET